MNVLLVTANQFCGKDALRELKGQRFNICTDKFMADKESTKIYVRWFDSNLNLWKIQGLQFNWVIWYRNSDEFYDQKVLEFVRSRII